MRNEMIGAIVRRAIEHPEFRRRLIESPQDALQSHGFALEADEMAGDREDPHDPRRMRVTSEQRLVSIAESYGVDPRPRVDPFIP